jgi:hypothetical protein
VPGQEVVVERVKGVKYAQYAPMPFGMYVNGGKMGGFAHFSAYKLPKMLGFFLLKST